MHRLARYVRTSRVREFADRPRSEGRRISRSSSLATIAEGTRG
jgi:hypothetical protein